MMILNDKIYNIFKWIVQIVLPALATLYFALSQFWTIPNPDLVVGSIMALSMFFGTMLGVSNMQYQTKTYNELVDTKDWPIEDTPPVTFLSKDIYEFLKWLTIMFFPAAATMYFAFAKMWGLPYGQEVVGTIAAVTAFMGILLGIGTLKLRPSVVTSSH